MLRTGSAMAVATMCFMSLGVYGDEVQVKALNRGPGGFFVFEPELVRIKPGDIIDFIVVDKGHDIHSLSGMLPDGAQPFEGKTNQDMKITFSTPGVYVIACQLHTRMGMVGVVVVGDPVNLGKIDPSVLPPKARAKLEALLGQIKGG